MYNPTTRRNLMSLAVASACAAFVAPGYTQEQPKTAAEPAPAAASAPADVQTVVVSGLRSSLRSSLNLKRQSDGIVDGIVAADIGKFPDTNLAESLQRISGVSIDRTNGEGSRVTVRGVGPDFNLVLLNGRQMPTSNLGDLSGRAFDFANLASEAISQIQVYKTSRAESPTGGIGATINVMTARPLENKKMLATVGVKGVKDLSADRLPADVKAGAKSLTPEVSGLYSNTFADGKFGVAISGSYQERSSGYNQASVPNGWFAFRGDNIRGPLALPGAPGSEKITNRPGPNDIYSRPQNLNYSMTGVQRQRTNGQLTLQYAPSKELTTTLDYTYAENKIQTRRNDLSAWFADEPSTSSWTKGPVSGPLVYSEVNRSASADVAMGGAQFATKTQNNSLGFNAVWKPTDRLKVEFDVHKSTAESQPDSPFGSSNTLGTARFTRGTTTADFSHEFPVLSIDGGDFAAASQKVTGSVFQNGYMKGEVEQLQTKGRLQIGESSALNFGLAATTVDNRSAFSNQQRDTWGGASTPADQSVFHAETVRQYFNKLDGSSNPKLFNTFYTFNFAQVRDLAAKAAGSQADLYLPKTTFDTDQRVSEKSKAGFVQFNTEWDTAIPMHSAVGVRFEKTDVISTALVPGASGLSWGSNNEINVIRSGTQTFTTLTGKYSNVLPSLDFDIDPTKDTKLRVSYGETIGRPRYDQIQGGQTIENLVRVNGGNGRQGNPGLLPVKSKNFDLSAEWYYGKQNFMAVGFFRKNLENYTGQSVVTATPFNLHTPIGGALWNEAIANSCTTQDTTCIRNYIFRNHSGAPGVTRGADNESGNATGTIVGQPSDPIATFEILSFANQKSASLSGAELNLQHMFGDTGFGVSANYTNVRSGLRFDNASLGDQFALVGLSNSANLVGIYEDSKWNVRAAYNWRGEFLAATFDSERPNPVYVEGYGQLDLSVGYEINSKLSLQFEAINLTDSTARVRGRTKEQALYVTQTAPRYMIGARYKF